MYRTIAHLPPETLLRNEVTEVRPRDGAAVAPTAAATVVAYQPRAVWTESMWHGALPALVGDGAADCGARRARRRAAAGCPGCPGESLPRRPCGLCGLQSYAVRGTGAESALLAKCISAGRAARRSAGALCARPGVRDVRVRRAAAPHCVRQAAARRDELGAGADGGQVRAAAADAAAGRARAACAHGAHGLLPAARALDAA